MDGLFKALLSTALVGQRVWVAVEDDTLIEFGCRGVTNEYNLAAPKLINPFAWSIDEMQTIGGLAKLGRILL